MGSPFITITKGGPTQDIDDGVYPVVLIDIKGPKTVTAQRGPNAGQEVELLDWEFAVDEGEMEGFEISVSSSTASGPRSKTYAFLTALFGGKTPPVGTQLQKDQIVGRRALATIQHNDGGWPVIANLGAMPVTAPMGLQAPATPTDNTAMVPVQRAPRPQPPLNETVERPAAAAVAVAARAANDDLPF
jgi:hypothetical protein